MSFLVIICLGSVFAYLPQYFFGDRGDLRMAMRHGMALGLLFTGIDHFASAHIRYLPMIPDVLAPVGLELVYASGLAELAAAVVLLVPERVFTRIGWRNAHRAAGIALAGLFSLLVVANINVAVKGSGVHGLDFGNAYFLIRPLFQPLFVLWALYCSGVSSRFFLSGKEFK